jgi:hypothetical protein
MGHKEIELWALEKVHLDQGWGQIGVCFRHKFQKGR